MSDKKKQITAVKGTKDVLPQDAKNWQNLESKAKEIFELYGYREIRTPIFEPTELFEKGTGETTDIVNKEMYTFIDKGGRSLTLRPEYTPSVVRSIIEHRLHLLPQPLRFYYVGPMFRYDKPQKGRYRQFHQVDVEVFGEKDPAIDAELVEMALFFIKTLGVEETEVLVNSVGCQKCRPAYHVDLQKKAVESETLLCQDCRRKISSNPLRIFDCKVDSCREVSRSFPKITDYLCGECRDHFQSFCSYLGSYGIPFIPDPFLVRGLDYYTKTTFEFISSDLGAQDALVGGGRYDDMMRLFGGPDLCAIGFAMGVERLLSIMSSVETRKDWVYVAFRGDRAKKKGMELSRFFRQHGVECLIEYKGRTLKNQLSRANKLKATWVLIIGEDELKSNRYQLKNMETGAQEEAKQQDLLALVGK
jgi:histidyl-tRNA synthetase